MLSWTMGLNNCSKAQPTYPLSHHTTSANNDSRPGKISQQRLPGYMRWIELAQNPASARSTTTVLKPRPPEGLWSPDRLARAERNYAMTYLRNGLAALAAAGVAFRLAMRQEALRLRFDAAWLRLPLIGRLARGYNSARFASTLAMLTAAGVPILKALQAAADTLSNQALRADALEALVRVREGAPLGTALAQNARFPGLLSMFARLGEQTGQLPLMLQRAAQQLSSEVQRRAMALATVLEPLLIVAMGGVVMLIVLAVLMPIMQLNQWVK